MVFGFVPFVVRIMFRFAQTRWKIYMVKFDLVLNFAFYFMLQCDLRMYLYVKFFLLLLLVFFSLVRCIVFVAVAVLCACVCAHSFSCATLCECILLLCCVFRSFLYSLLFASLPTSLSHAHS